MDRPRRRRTDRRARSRRRIHQLRAGHSRTGRSRCARVDADGPWCALVQNGATGARYTAVRGAGAQLDRRTRSHPRRPRTSRAPSSPCRDGHPSRWAGGSSARSDRPPSRCVMSRRVTSTATSTGTPTSTRRGTTSAHCSCARKRARWWSTPTDGIWSRSRPARVGSSSPPARKNCSRSCTEGSHGDDRSRSRRAARRGPARGRGRCRDRARRVRRREQRAHEGSRRLGERRRHVERARDPRGPARRGP